VVGVPLTEESLPLFRDRTLREQSHRLSSLPKRRRKHKSTQASRKKQEDDYNAAQLRRQRRTEQHLAVQTDHFLMRLQKLERNFSKNQELRFAQINTIKLRMRTEEETFRYQRLKLAQNVRSHQGTFQESFVLHVLLAICSPLWIPFVLIFNLYGRYTDDANKSRLRAGAAL
jgi:hypothetical protein